MTQHASSGCRFILGNLTLIKCSCILGIVVGCLIFNKVSRYYFVLLSRPATNGVNQRLNDQIRLDSRVNYYYSPLALRRYSFVANNVIC
ncbi:hypothetical protein T12_9900 [Trichinella patagoniensis]|uniref:Uncharacterized protein n=1 Tax=Trichinella patagoniensis TaxID=990121 RepID=A0A0V0YUZ6_9BILA|nr:hypothetical protein T12_9900 [Trichinella patagoniensis]